MKLAKQLGLMLVLLVLAAGVYLQTPQPESVKNDQIFADWQQLFERRASDIQVLGEGVVLKILRDDVYGSRHQKFIISVGNDRTLLIAHNIDLAPRVENLQRGDSVRFAGEYEWNPKGGVIHWTHHDPAGRHPPGWIEHNGKLYQ